MFYFSVIKMDIRLFTGLFQLYSYWEVLVIMSVSAVAVNSFYSIFSKKTFNFLDLRITLFTLIFNYIYFVIGVFVYSTNLFLIYWNPEYKLMIDQNNVLFDLYIHLINLFVLILLTIGWSIHKKSSTNYKKFFRLFTSYFLGLIILIGKYQWLN